MRALLLFVAALALAGCSSLWHFSDPSLDDAVGDVCSVLASNNREAIEAEAARRGMLVDDVLKIFTTTCSMRMRLAAGHVVAAARVQIVNVDAIDAGAP